jgi:hypothetical protein
MKLRPWLAAALSTLALAAHAHEGHGAIHDSHWHASDAYGFMALGAAVIIAIWLSRGD